MRDCPVLPAQVDVDLIEQHVFDDQDTPGGERDPD